MKQKKHRPELDGNDKIVQITENVDKKGLFYVIRRLPEKFQKLFEWAYVKKNDWWYFEEEELRSVRQKIKKKGYKVKIAKMSQAVMSLGDALELDNTEVKRLKTKIKQFDELLNGGFAKGSVIAFGGDPGVGKSTLATQLLLKWSRKKRRRCAYINSEETVSQVVERFKRLNADQPFTNTQKKNLIIKVLTSPDLARAYLKKEEVFSALVVDSVSGFEQRGSIKTQREVAAIVHDYVKWVNPNCVAIVVCQVTKEHEIAGPKSLQHMVDTILYISGNTRLRRIQPTKNRFGSTAGKIDVQMDETGLIFEDSQITERITNSPNQTLASSGGSNEGWEELR